MSGGTYDTALVCLNGHTVNSATRNFPEHTRAFCEWCGKAAISKCPRCSRPIRGDFNIQGVFAPSAYVAPAFCGECGTAMPWTESRLQAAHDLIEEMDELTPEDKKRLNESVSELPKDSPRTGLAVTRIKKIAMKVGKDTWGIFEKILIDVASQTAKKTLGLP